MEGELKPWQKELARRIVEGLERGERLIINVPPPRSRFLVLEEVRRIRDLYDFVVDLPPAPPQSPSKPLE